MSDQVPVPRWLADAVQAMALNRGERATAEKLGVPVPHVARLAGMLPVARATLESALGRVPGELRPSGGSK